LLGGILLVLVGLAWLLEAVDAVDVPWDVLLPLALVAVGAVLIVNARTGARQGGLVAIGVALTVLLFLGSAIDVPLGGGVGDRTVRPSDDGPRSFELAVGKLTVDLRDLEVSQAPLQLDARVGVGQLVVLVPAGVAVAIEGRAGLGNVVVFEQEEGGVDAEVVHEPERDPVVTIEATVGIGEVKVERG
jgi:hypothetical protein